MRSKWLDAASLDVSRHPHEDTTAVEYTVRFTRMAAEM